MRLRPFAIALLLPLFIAAVTLGAVAWNRSGGRGPIVLSEREVQAPVFNDDNTTATLWLAWQAERQGPEVTSETELRRGFAALTLKDDPLDVASKDEVASGFRRKASRLFVVDTDRDAATLQRRYPDGRTHIITAATLVIPADGSYEKARVVSLDPQRLHVPREWVGQLAKGSFDVELWYGLRYEPWVSAIRQRPAR